MYLTSKVKLHYFFFLLVVWMIVQEALRTRGLKDDTMCIVVDIIPPDTAMPPPSPPCKKPSKFSLRSLFFRKKFHGLASKLSKKLSAVGIVKELFEEGSAMLSERLVFLKQTQHFSDGRNEYLNILGCNNCNFLLYWRV